MALQKDHFLTQLFFLRPTEEHLKSLALYLKAFEDDFGTIKEGIEYTHHVSSIHHRITLYYLINELLNMRISQKLKAELKNFTKEKFHKDIQLSLGYETLNKRILELESVWRHKRTIGFGDKYNLEEVISKIKESFYDRAKFIEVLKELLEQCKHPEN
ncbi:uncharacterized protein VICG_01227 [Vittaforma corneae ATCC 50505]|uniref:CID domain-containing protein n=1 Tax=Vittaforma corneae (strain ATCC 50505) TaxID=993615 RepID=L2GLG2_VITCO|nr:uncharacterized protein VICG_01227 [Vittaforma corneae ATCC 50505]ELA41723.1 hypothetical protein VICG_01227 [Vittaforma corneae ATCC 50505]